jgi:hypothetical protein
MGRIKDLQDALLDAIGASIVEYGFLPRKRMQRYVRKTEFGKLSYHVNFGPRGAGIVAMSDVAVRFTALEDLVNSVNTEMLKAQRRDTYSVAQEVGALLGERWLEWDLDVPEKAPQVARSMMAAFEQGALPFLNRYSDMNRVFEVLAAAGPEAEFIVRLPSRQAKNAIALAYLFSARPRFDELVSLYRTRLQQSGDPNLPSFDRLVSELTRRFDQSPTNAPESPS